MARSRPMSPLHAPLAASPLRAALLLCSLLILSVATIAVRFAPASAQTPLDPTTLTKYVDAMPVPVPMARAGKNFYEIGAWPVQQKLHRDLPPTHLYGYGPTQATATYPGMTIEATRGVPLSIHWTNHLPLPHILSYAFDPTIGHPEVTTGVPTAPHVHGGEQEPQSDGGPFTWFTPGFAEKGMDWKHETYVYANRQQATTIWYHDHAYGYTRHNVYAGLAGFYLLRDPLREPRNLPSGKYEIPVVIQDRMLFDNGELNYALGGDNPEIHPVWAPEFFGDIIVVNGKVWPYLNVDQHKYRFRLLDGSQARFYSLALVNSVTGARGPAFVQIGTDGGYLPHPVILNNPFNSNAPRLLIAPGERADVVIDFGNVSAGSEWILTNTANGPYPMGDPVDPATTGQIMKFKVMATRARDLSSVPLILNLNGPRLGKPTKVRQMTLNEVEGANGPVAMYLNGMEMMAPATETPMLYTTEEWDIVNTTVDTHPMHLHLVQFQLLNREAYDRDGYMTTYEAANPVLPTASPVAVPVGPYLSGVKTGPDPNENGWKDTIRMNPFEVTRILVRFAPQDNAFGPRFAFDATAAPGYVWHCHILEHEENDMMRPLLMTAPTPKVLAMLDAAPADESVPADAVALAPQAPTTPELMPAMPNPIQSSTVLRFSLPAAASVDLRVFDVQGQQVRVLASGPFGAGEHRVSWSGNDEGGRSVAPGVYFLRMQAGGVMRTQRVVLIP
ncbi:MAG: multicopper oxidase domain-containing protein [Candidatus Eiseniibacteriota bacterium]